MKLILNCGNNDRDATLKLLQWKNSRVPFWTISQTETANGIEIFGKKLYF